MLNKFRPIAHKNDDVYNILSFESYKGFKTHRFIPKFQQIVRVAPPYHPFVW